MTTEFFVDPERVLRDYAPTPHPLRPWLSPEAVRRLCRTEAGFRELHELYHAREAEVRRCSGLSDGALIASTRLWPPSERQVEG